MSNANNTCIKLCNKKKRKENKIHQRWVKKKRDRRSPNSTRKAQKCNERLMYETKGVEPCLNGTSNALEVLTRYNP